MQCALALTHKNGLYLFSSHDVPHPNLLRINSCLACYSPTIYPLPTNVRLGRRVHPGRSPSSPLLPLMLPHGAPAKCARRRLEPDVSAPRGALISRARTYTYRSSDTRSRSPSVHGLCLCLVLPRRAVRGRVPSPCVFVRPFGRRRSHSEPFDSCTTNLSLESRRALKGYKTTATKLKSDVHE